MKVTRKGQGRPIIGIVGRLHGNEPLGETVIDELLKKDPQTQLVCIIANEEAAQKDVRFMEVDLNRCFPGNEKGNTEERLAAQILSELKLCDYVIDIHATTAKTEEFIIMTRESEQIWRLANCLPIKKVAVMQAVLSKGNALIDHVRGVSIEFPRTVQVGKVVEIVEECVRRLVSSEPITDKKEVFEVYGSLPKSEGHSIKNFAETTIDGETFIPILFGEVEYKDIACLKARRISG